MRTLLVLILVGVAVYYSACNPTEIVQAQKSFERDMPDATFNRQVTLSFGSGTMGLARWITSKIDDRDAHMVSEYLRDVDMVEVGVYEIENLPNLARYEMPDQLLRMFEEGGWEQAAVVRDHDELVWLLYKENGQTVEDMFAVVLQQDRLVMARLHGNLNALMAKVVEDHRIFSHLGMRPT